jgi:hypothetical protein
MGIYRWEYIDEKVSLFCCPADKKVVSDRQYLLHTLASGGRCLTIPRASKNNAVGRSLKFFQALDRDRAIARTSTFGPTHFRE